MTQEDPTHTTEFEAESRERLARLEANQGHLQSSVEDVREGQDEVLDRLDDLRENTVTEEDLEEIEEEAGKNTIGRQRWDAVIQAGAVLAGVVGGIAGYVQFIA